MVMLDFGLMLIFILGSLVSGQSVSFLHFQYVPAKLRLKSAALAKGSGLYSYGVLVQKSVLPNFWHLSNRHSESEEGNVFQPWPFNHRGN